jgi:CheY-like chemotaxis protein
MPSKAVAKTGIRSAIERTDIPSIDEIENVGPNLRHQMCFVADRFSVSRPLSLGTINRGWGFEVARFPLTLFLVEDDPQLAWALKAQAEDLGYRVIGTARTGEEAVEQVPRMRPSVVLMDVRLEGSLSGIEAAQGIRRKSTVPIVFCTVLAEMPAVRGQIAALRNSSLIGKPVSEARLRRSLKDAIEASL